MTGTARQSPAAAGPFGGISLSELADRIRRRDTSSREITEQAATAALEYGAQLGCFVTVDRQGAERAAQVADEELASGIDRGPLHGIPVGVKDIIATSGLTTTMGSRHFADHVPHGDAGVVTALRRAGAIVLGKTHTHEFAYGPTGDRAHTGPVRNPHDPARMAGGSSGGSAAAVAAGLVPVALGTDTGGSVRIPAALCGTVGLRPGEGALSAEGVFPLSPTLDTVGPLAGTVSDTALAWWALSCPPDLAGMPRRPWSPALWPDTSRAANVRIAQVRSELTERITSGQRETLQMAAAAMSAGDLAVSEIPLPEVDACVEPYRVIQSSEAAAIHSSRVDKAPELFDPEVLERLQAATDVRGWEYVQALQTRERLRSEVLDRMASVDVLLAPTVPVDAPEVGQRQLADAAGWATTREALLALTSPWSVLGLPAISVPVDCPGVSMPRAIQLIGKPGQEGRLLDTAARLETALRQKSGDPW